MHEPAKVERSGAPWTAVALLAGLAGGLLGAGATWLLAAARAEKAAAPTSVRDEALAAQVADLSRRIEALNQALAHPPDTGAAPAGDDTGASPPLADAAALRASIDALALALRDIVVQGGPVQASAPAEPHLVIPPTDPSRRSALESQIDRDIQVLRDRHLFWTDQELLDAYGPPDFIAVQDGVEQWTYAFASGSAAFAMHLRRVFDVYTE